VLQECISQSALITKFAHHVSNAAVIVSDLRKLWEQLHQTSQRHRLLLQHHVLCHWVTLTFDLAFRSAIKRNLKLKANVQT